MRISPTLDPTAEGEIIGSRLTINRISLPISNLWATREPPPDLGAPDVTGRATDYSSRSTTTGSTRAARRAGRRQAVTVTTPSTAEPSRSVTGSPGEMS